MNDVTVILDAIIQRLVLPAWDAGSAIAHCYASLNGSIGSSLTLSYTKPIL